MTVVGHGHFGNFFPTLQENACTLQTLGQSRIKGMHDYFMQAKFYTTPQQYSSRV